MILQALKDYYDRKAADPTAGMAPEGWEWKPLPFLVVIGSEGQFLRFEDTREDDAKRFLVPALGEKKGNGIKANLLWENIEYVFGIPVPTKTKPSPDTDRVSRQHAAFTARIQELGTGHPALLAASRFVLMDHSEAVGADPLWPEVLSVNQGMLLSYHGQGPLTDIPEVRRTVNSCRKGGEPLRGRCLVTGEYDDIVLLEPPIKGVRGAQPTGASLVAVNNKVTNGTNAGATPAFASLLKQQGHNSPIGRQASFAYTTALNHLLRYDSPQRLQIGDATTVFWASRDNPLEQQFAAFFGESPKDDPDRNAQAVRGLLRAVETGAFAAGDQETRFYVLGLAPNAARIAVRFWHVDTVAGMSKTIAQHFLDTRITHGPGEQDTLSLFRLLVATAPLGKADNLAPSLAGDTMRAILGGLPYPATLLQAAVRRAKAEQSRKDMRTAKPLPNVPYARAALIKACINRAARHTNPNAKEELHVSLDPDNPNIGYRLGRLFAVLERIQAEASPGINATIRDRYYGAASGTPVAVFSTLMKLKNHHLGKLENRGRAVNLERIICEIMAGIQDFPAHLALADQGRFAIGYYHQTQAFFAPKDKPTNPQEV